MVEVKVNPIETIESKGRKEMEYAERGDVPEVDFFLDFVYDKDGNIKSTRVNIPRVANYILEHNILKTIFLTKSELIYYYHEGIYDLNGREMIYATVEELLGDYSSNHIIKEVVEKIKRNTNISIEDFDNVPEELLCVENGILDVKKKQLRPHSPEYYFKSKIQIKYNPELKCAEILKFVQETFYESDILLIQEWFGFFLYKRYFLKKAIILFGDSNTGKSVALNLMKKFIGEKNTAGISLHRIANNDKFAIMDLRNKFANIYDDLSSKDLESGGFKVATGDGYITGEKKFGDPTQFKNYAKHTFAANKIPSPKEIDSDDNAYFGRWIPIPCDNELDGRSQDKFLINKLTSEDEMSGLLNWALDGLQRLFNQGNFSFTKTPDEVRLLMEKHGNPLSSFIQDCLVHCDEGRISKQDMFEVYTEYVNQKNVAKLSIEQLGRRLPKKARYIMAKRDDERFWANVEFSDLEWMKNSLKGNGKSQKATTL